MIVDDVLYSILNLKKIIGSISSEIEIIAEITDPDIVIDRVKELHPDLIIFDIDFCRNDINGLMLADKVAEIYPETMIVYATAHGCYTANAFEGKAIVLGYITKPFNRIKVMRVLEKISTYSTKQRIEFKDKFGSIFYLSPKEIILIEKKVCTKNTIIHAISKSIETTETLTTIESKTNNFKNLKRVHRGFIINKDKIFSISNFNETSMEIKFTDNFPHIALITKDRAHELELIS
jgi:DNA-binding LytR/AlgR family response regulator